jgi:alkanesulfonate monooxygenase SsuD/methylene tetrahydromethanopterin reductase-like flavin-dependent oxidoreductase (luciferase family)
MTEPQGLLSIGVAGALGAAQVADVAASVSANGFDGLWVNDTPDGDAIEALGAASEQAPALRLATGVVPIDRVPPEEILRRIDRAGVDPAHLSIGIGAGGLRTGAVDAVSSAVALLRSRLPGSAVVVGALGPRMRRLAAEHADGVLLNWLDPRGADEQRREAHAVSARTRVALYVRTAVDPAAEAKARAEAARYALIPAYARNFERLGIDAADTMILGGDGDPVPRLSRYRRSVDEVVLRVVTAEDQAGSVHDVVGRIASLTPG